MDERKGVYPQHHPLLYTTQNVPCLRREPSGLLKWFFSALNDAISIKGVSFKSFDKAARQNHIQSDLVNLGFTNPFLNIRILILGNKF